MPSSSVIILVDICFQLFTHRFNLENVDATRDKRVNLQNRKPVAALAECSFLSRDKSHLVQIRQKLRALE